MAHKTRATHVLQKFLESKGTRPELSQKNLSIELLLAPSLISVLRAKRNSQNKLMEGIIGLNHNSSKRASFCSYAVSL